MNNTQPLTQIEFAPDDHKRAAELARRLGYIQTAYTSTSSMWGLFCLPENPERAKRGERTEGGCIIVTKELGMLFVQNLEELHFDDLFQDQLKHDARKRRKAAKAAK
jgi:hypothetical protein